MPKHSAAFIAVRDRILALEDRDRARLAAFFGSITTRGGKLGELRSILRELAALDDDDLERFVGWFSQHVNNWGQTPRAHGRKIDPRAYTKPPES